MMMMDVASGTFFTVPAERARVRRTAYWLATGVASVAFVAPGVANLVRVPHIASDMGHLGYPSYFMSILGVWKVLGAAAILVPGFPRLKEWAYAGMMFDLSGAAISRVAVGDGAVKTIIPIIISLVVAASWALRPEGRMMKSS
jgi:uncharacterized membrane protein YphA (DoxX/SURF4 family)